MLSRLRMHSPLVDVSVLLLIWGPGHAHALSPVIPLALSTQYGLDAASQENIRIYGTGETSFSLVGALGVMEAKTYAKKIFIRASGFYQFFLHAVLR
jgi:hypothetical protein